MKRRDWYAELSPSDEHPVTLAVERRLQETDEYRELGKRILEAGQRLGSLLHGEAARLWLEVEAAMTDRCAIASAEYYNAGVEAGLAQRVLEDLLADPRAPTAATLRALAAVLERLARHADGAE